MSYIYFDINGRLREYVTTPKRKGSENVDTLFVYWEGNDGTVVLPSQCFIEYGHEKVHAGPLTANKVSRTIIPFERERDLKFFQYGKTYQFMCFDLPAAVSSTSGFWHSSVSIHDRLSNNVVQVLGDITFEVEESSIVPSGNLDLSQYNYLLDKVGQTLAKYDSKLDRKAPTSIVDSNENSIVDFRDNEATFYKPVHVNNEFRVKNDTGIIIEGGDGSGKFSSILDDYDLNEFSFITDRKAFYLTFREDVSKGLVFDSSQTLSLRNGTEFLNDANTKTVFGQAIKGSGDIHTWNGTPTNPKDITTKEYVDTKVSAETEGVVKSGDLKTLNGESLLGSGDITYDTSLSSTSTNAVQNKVVNSTISELSYQLAMVRENLFQTVLSEIDYTEDFATLYPIPDTLSDTDGTHRVLFSETQLREVAGNSIAYNQLVQNGNFESLEGYDSVGGSLSVKDNILTFTINTSPVDIASMRVVHKIDVVTNHKYLVLSSFNVPYDTDIRVFMDGRFSVLGKAIANTWTMLVGIYNGVKSNNSGNIYFDCIYQSSYKIGDEMQQRDYQLFDLTLMGLDSVSTVEEAKSELLKRGIDIDQYNPFSEGEIRNTTASGVKVNGYNLLNLDRTEGDTTGWKYENTEKRSFDETKYYVGMSVNNYWSPMAIKGYSVAGNSVMVNGGDGYGIGFPIRVFPGKTYQVEFTATDGTHQYRVGWYDREGKQISFDLSDNKNKVAPDNAYWGLLVLSPSTANTNVTFSNICFHLSTLRTGYAPYKEPKAISFASTELLGAGEAHDTIEVVEGDKVAGIQRYNLVKVKRIGTVDLGTINWVYESGNARFYSASTIDDMAVKPYGQNIYPNIVCSKYPAVPTYNLDQHQDKAISTNNSQATPRIFVADSSYTDATAFKTAMNGVILNYELATPTRTIIAENLTFEEVSATIEQGGSIETVYETLAPNCTTGFVVKKATEVSK